MKSIWFLAALINQRFKDKNLFNNNKLLPKSGNKRITSQALLLLHNAFCLFGASAAWVVCAPSTSQNSVTCFNKTIVRS